MGRNSSSPTVPGGQSWPLASPRGHRSLGSGAHKSPWAPRQRVYRRNLPQQLHTIRECAPESAAQRRPDGGRHPGTGDQAYRIIAIVGAHGFAVNGRGHATEQGKDRDPIGTGDVPQMLLGEWRVKTASIPCPSAPMSVTACAFPCASDRPCTGGRQDDSQRSTCPRL